MTDHSKDRRNREEEASPETGQGRVGSGAPVSEDPTGDAEYRGADDREDGPIFVETPDGEHEYGR